MAGELYFACHCSFMQMLNLITKLTQQADELANFNSLGDFVYTIDINALQYLSFVPEAAEKSYTKNILLEQPVEVAILYWPPGSKSGIHKHDGFFGYVLVLEGEIHNTEYQYENNELKEMQAICGRRGAVIPERENIIHMLSNNSVENPCISLHIYYPPLLSLEGMQIFDAEKGRVGILSASAATAGWDNPPGGFKQIMENAFKYYPFNEHAQASHHIFPVLPKPAPLEIDQMIATYYDEQADDYDEFDRTHKKRKQYIDGINAIIAEDFKRLNKLDAMLALASGTGRRTLDIQKLSGRNYRITGVDISIEMTEEAREKGIDAVAADWVGCELPQTDYDAATFLYAFGHICNWEERRTSLRKVYDHLRPGAPFYLDVFNIDDQNEWGPSAVKLYNDLRLADMGYEPGDVFYKKYGGRAVSYLRYFRKENLINLLEQCGFTIEWVKQIGYNVNPGEVLPEGQEGVLFVKAVKG